MELKATDYAVADGIATVWLDRPHRLNAWTGRMHAEYRWCLAQAEQNPNVRVIVVTGRGRGFCVGGDTEALAGHAQKGGYDPGTPSSMAMPGFGKAPEFDASFAYHFGLSKPVLAAINGPAAGVGLALACFADLRFAAAGAKFTTAHGRLNLPAEYGLSWLLPRMVGLTGPEKDIDAVAQRYGIAYMRQKPNAQGAYLVDHARIAVLYGPKGEPIAIMPQNAKPQALADELARWVR